MRASRVGLAARITAIALTVSVQASCVGNDHEAERAASGVSELPRLLVAGQSVFGIFSGEKTPEQGARMAGNREIDFVFYSLESGPFDIPQMRAYMSAMADAAERLAGRGAAAAEGRSVAPTAAHHVALRIPPIRSGPAAARDRVRRGLEAGVAAIVFPHVESAADAALAVEAMGGELWPGNPDGRLVNMLIVEDRVGIANVREIVGTPGVSVAFAGPGDLRRAYDGDMRAVEAAIQAVLAACKEFDVACGITAGVDDIAERLAQGFRVIIVTEPEALAVGRRAAGRTR